MQEGIHVVLDRTTDVWVGLFPGLGSVRVGPDGSVDVEVEPAMLEEPVHLRHDALFYGWGEPLSLARRGFTMLDGVALRDPTSHRVLLLSGDLHDTNIVALALASRGWLLLADRVVPTVLDDDRVMVHPRSAPLLVSKRRADRLGLASRSVRGDSDAAIVDVPRSDVVCELAAVVRVQTRRPHQSRFTVLSGHDRFDAVRRIQLGGVLLPVTTAADSMARTLRLASLPVASLCLEVVASGDQVDPLLDWWESL